MSVFWQHLIFAIIESGWIKCDGGEARLNAMPKTTTSSEVLSSLNSGMWRKIMFRKSDILANVKEYYWSCVGSNVLWGALIFPVGIAVIMVLIFSGDEKMYGAIAMLSSLVGVLLMYCSNSFVHYIKTVKSIKELCPTEAEQIQLEHDFAGSVSVFNKAMRIGKDYTFMAKDTECKIVDTHKIVSFRHTRGSGRQALTVIYAVVDDLESVPFIRHLNVTSVKETKQAEDLILEATSVLRQKREESGEDFDATQTLENEKLAIKDLEKMAYEKESIDTLKAEFPRRIVFGILGTFVIIGYVVYDYKHYHFVDKTFLLLIILMTLFMYVPIVNDIREYFRQKKEYEFDLMDYEEKTGDVSEEEVL